MKLYIYIYICHFLQNEYNEPTLYLQQGGYSVQTLSNRQNCYIGHANIHTPADGPTKQSVEVASRAFNLTALPFV